MEALLSKAMRAAQVLSDRPYKKLILLAFASVALYQIKQRMFNRNRNNTTNSQLESHAVNMEFLSNIWKLLKIVFPKPIGRETSGIALFSALLILKTMLSIHTSDISGSIVKAIVNKNLMKFLKHILRLCLFAIPGSVINSSLEYFSKILGLYFRENLTNYFHSKYLNTLCYYQLTNFDHTVSNPDQIFTNAIDKWSYCLSNIYSNFSKPLLDIILFSKKLSETIGYEGPLLIIGWYILSGVLLKFTTPAFGELTAEEQRLEGEFRSCHTALLNHSEEIAFFRGNKWEEQRIENVFNSLISHVKSIFLKKFYMGIFHTLMIKYGAAIIGYSLIGFPVFYGSSGKYLHKTASYITKDYVTNSSLLISLSKAIGRIVISYKDFQNLSGYTTLVCQLDEAIDRINKEDFFNKSKIHASFKFPGGIYNETDSLSSIEFISVPVITPTGDILLENLTFQINQGCHTLIHGPNGCGKSSLFRILGKLWPVLGGKINKPTQSHIFYIPQRPYLPIGTLRDQVIYPHTVNDFRNSQKTDLDIISLLEIVDVDYVRKKDLLGLDAIKNWNDDLSGGEKQKFAMARLFYHCPRFAILDECTSNMSQDIEGKLYTYAKNLGITLITVSHRKTLWKYHDYILKINGDVRIINLNQLINKGTYSFGKMENDLASLENGVSQTS